MLLFVIVFFLKKKRMVISFVITMLPINIPTTIWKSTDDCTILTNVKMGTNYEMMVFVQTKTHCYVMNTRLYYLKALCL